MQVQRSDSLHLLVQQRCLPSPLVDIYTANLPVRLFHFIRIALYPFITGLELLRLFGTIEGEPIARYTPAKGRVKHQTHALEMIRRAVGTGPYGKITVRKRPLLRIGLRALFR